ncbi:hypothetical protein ACQJBY_071240 [Aegilops geniculata]
MEMEAVPDQPPKRGRGRPRRPEPEGSTRTGCCGNSDNSDGRNCGWTNSDRCNCGVMVGNGCNCGRPVSDIKCCGWRNKATCHCDSYLLSKIRDPRQKTLNQAQTKIVEEKTREIGSKLPVFVKLMKQPDIQKPDLNFCTTYASKCLWHERNCAETRALLVLEGTKWCSKLTVDIYQRKEIQPSRFIKFKAWKTVVLEAGMKAQDICLFELVGRCNKGLTMKVHLIRNSFSRSELKVKRSLCPSSSTSDGPLQKKMHAPDSSGATASTEPSPKAPAEETHAPPAGPEGSEETWHTVTEEDHVTSHQPHEDLPAPAGRNEPREGLRLINQLQLDLEKAQAELRTQGDTTKKALQDKDKALADKDKALADAREKNGKLEEELKKEKAKWAKKFGQQVKKIEVRLDQHLIDSTKYLKDTTKEISDMLDGNSSSSSVLF